MTEKALAKSEPKALDHLEDLTESARAYLRESVSQATREAYRCDWAHFSEWAGESRLGNLPASPETIALYVTHLADSGFKVSTISRRLVAISQVHQAAGYDDPPTADAAVRQVLKGIKRQKKTAPEKKKAITTSQIRAWVATLDRSNPKDVRDRALVLTGYAGALRRSELVGLDVEDLEFVEQGVVLTLKASKTNQEGELELVAIPSGVHRHTCPVTALKRWLETAGLESGPLFRGFYYGGKMREGRLSAKAVALVVKRLCRDLGYSQEDCRDYAAHSLRAGHATEAIEGGASETVTMQQTRHRSEKVFRGYVRRGNLFRRNSAKFLGL